MGAVGVLWVAMAGEETVHETPVLAVLGAVYNYDNRSRSQDRKK